MKKGLTDMNEGTLDEWKVWFAEERSHEMKVCLLYTSDAADE